METGLIRSFRPSRTLPVKKIDIFVSAPEDVAAAQPVTHLYLIHAADPAKGEILLQGATIKAKHTFFDKEWSNVEIPKDQRVVGLAIRLDGELVIQPEHPSTPETPSNPDTPDTPDTPNEPNQPEKPVNPPSQPTPLPPEDEIVLPGTVKPNDNSETLTGAALGNLAFVNQGADFALDAAMYAAKEVFISEKPSLWVPAAGERSKYKTGPDILVQGARFALGGTYKADNTVRIGFLEAGHGQTKTCVPDTATKNKQNYLGVGAAFRTEFDSGFYIEGMLRGGAFKSKFHGSYDTGDAGYKAYEKDENQSPS